MYMVGYIVQFIQHNYITHQYSTRMGIKQKRKIAFIAVENECTYIWIGFGFSLYALKKLIRQREEEQKKTIRLQTGKEVMHQSLSLNA